MKPKLNNQFQVIVIMGLLTAIAPLSTDMYLPAFPAIAKSLHTDISQVTLSLSSFFIGISAGQLIYGPLLERFGRKRPLYGGLCLYFLAAVGCALTTSVESLIVFRCLQAVGGCVGMVASRALVRDLFEVRENAKIFSLLMLVVSVAPIIAPTVGGYITAVLGWRYVFAMMISIVLFILFGAYHFLPEGKAPDPDYSLKPNLIVKSYLGVLRHPQFFTYALTGATSYAGLYAYIGGAPQVFMQVYQVSEAQFGWIFAFIAAGLIGASQVNTLALRRFSSETIIAGAGLCQSLLGLSFVAFALLGLSNLWSTIGFVFLFLACQGFIFPNSTALALAPVGKNAGTASALIGGIQMGAGALVSAIISQLHSPTNLPMIGVMTGCATLAHLVFRVGRNYLSRLQA